MAEHYTRNTESVTKWCNACNRLTQHRVSDGRVGRCMEHQVEGESQKQRRARLKREADAAQNAALRLFRETPREPGEEG